MIMSFSYFVMAPKMQPGADKPPQYCDLPRVNSPTNHKIPTFRAFQNRMDLHHATSQEELGGHPGSIEGLQPFPRQSDPRSRNSQPPPFTQPLPQAQWASAPAHPPDLESLRANTPHDRVSDLASLQRTQSVGPASRLGTSPPGFSASRQRRKPRPLDQERLRQPINPSMLYPQMSPYAAPSDDFSQDTFEYYPRSVSQPVTPGLPEPMTDIDSLTTTFSRAPTYPSAGNRKSGRRESRIRDSGFDDEHQFRLFVEATAGLGPIPSMDDDFSPTIPSSSRSQGRDPSRRHGSEAGAISSPVAETPTTVQALQHLAQMPESTPPLQPERSNLQSFGSEFDSWLQAPPSHQRLAQRRSNPSMSSQASPEEDWQSVPDVSPIEEELPDYAASQAQAQASHRAEATRRAQELQRRWQQSGSRMVRYG